ncbi:hypothetical protein ACIQVT_01180 [Streptomyces sp. NPDC100445]|uniref:hypothetical protein n=1 Tax=Streptomyces sp. NPDC100445 TaxID=3366102 RepID=UPI0037FAD7B9
MTRPVVSPAELDSQESAAPRPHAERDLTEVWRRPRAERPFHRQPSGADRPGRTRLCDVLTAAFAPGTLTRTRHNPRPEIDALLAVAPDEEGDGTVTVWASSAGRDAVVSADPDRFAPAHRPDTHPAFGFGALLPAAERTGPERWTHPGIRHGMSRLPVALAPEGR